MVGLASGGLRGGHLLGSRSAGFGLGGSCGHWALRVDRGPEPGDPEPGDRPVRVSVKSHRQVERLVSHSPNPDEEVSPSWIGGWADVISSRVGAPLATGLRYLPYGRMVGSDLTVGRIKVRVGRSHGRLAFGSDFQRHQRLRQSGDFFDRTVRERLLDAACVVMANRTSGEVRYKQDNLGFQTFVAAMLGRCLRFKATNPDLAWESD
jgi:hypothetical protein